MRPSAPTWAACSTDVVSAEAPRSFKAWPATHRIREQLSASEIGKSGVRTSCYDAFGSGRALAAGGGVDVHLNDRIAIRVIADYRRLAVPSLEGMETVFMEPDADARLDMVRVAVGFVLGI